MKSLAEHMAFYSSYHRDPRNRLTHFFGVPTIVYAILIAMSFGRIPLGGLEISLSGIFVGAMLLYYLSLDWVLGLTMAAIFVPMCWAAQETVKLGTGTALVIFAVTFVGGWVIQLIGHKFEGNRPALMDNLFQTLVSPIFLTAEIFFMLGLKLPLKEEVERRVLTRDFAGAEHAFKQARAS
jgi:uncharacterized membrane protein YGL010W